MTAVSESDYSLLMATPIDPNPLRGALDFIESVYNHRNEDGTLPFGLLDYYHMEDLMKQLREAILNQ